MNKTNNLTFREIGPSDMELLEAFFVQNNIPEVTDTFTAFPMSEESARSITQRSHKDKYYFLFSDEQAVGVSMLRGFDEGYSVPSFGILIDHRFHNQGFGKRLLELTVEQARLLGCEQIRLSVYGINAAGRKIYEGIGFREIDRSAVVRNGATDEKIIMIKELK